MNDDLTGIGPDAEADADPERHDFIRAFVREDLAAGRTVGAVMHAHGHAKDDLAQARDAGVGNGCLRVARQRDATGEGCND